MTKGSNQDGESGVQWKKLKEKINEEISEVKWTATVPDLTEKIADLLDIKIPEIWLASWKKQLEIRETIQDSIESPDKTFYVELAEHTINSEHRPYIEISLKEAVVKKFEFVLSAIFKLKGFVLKIKDGAINEIQTGNCRVEGSLKYQDLTLAKKELSPIKLPGVFQF